VTFVLFLLLSSLRYQCRRIRLISHLQKLPFLRPEEEEEEEEEGRSHDDKPSYI
jgi:hypothetical protein